MIKNEAVATLEIERAATRHHPPPDEIAVRAYEIFLERGATPGHDLDDWFQAEEELVKKRGNVVPHRGRPSDSSLDDLFGNWRLVGPRIRPRVDPERAAAFIKPDRWHTLLELDFSYETYLDVYCPALLA